MGAAAKTPMPTVVAADPNDVNAPVADTAAVVTYAAGTNGQCHHISGLTWSYSAAPTGGNIKVEDGAGNTVFSLDITAAGVGFFIFDPVKRGTANAAMTITLAAGGGSVVGKLSIPAHWVEVP